MIIRILAWAFFLWCPIIIKARDEISSLPFCFKPQSYGAEPWLKQQKIVGLQFWFSRNRKEQRQICIKIRLSSIYSRDDF